MLAGVGNRQMGVCNKIFFHYKCVRNWKTCKNCWNCPIHPNLYFRSPYLVLNMMCLLSVTCPAYKWQLLYYLSKLPLPPSSNLINCCVGFVNWCVKCVLCEKLLSSTIRPEVAHCAGFFIVHFSVKLNCKWENDATWRLWFCIVQWAHMKDVLIWVKEVTHHSLKKSPWS